MNENLQHRNRTAFQSYMDRRAIGGFRPFLLVGQMFSR